MTLAVAVAKSTGEDVSQTLLDRAAVEDNPVRQGILQLMADKGKDILKKASAEADSLDTGIGIRLKVSSSDKLKKAEEDDLDKINSHVIEFLQKCQGAQPEQKKTVRRYYYDGSEAIVRVTNINNRGLVTVETTDEKYEKITGVAPVGGEEGLTLTERNSFRPTIEVNGIHSGYGGPGSKTVIPAGALAKLSMRLVPNQNPDEAMAAVERHLKLHTPRGMKLFIEDLTGEAAGFRLPLASPVFRLAASVLEELDPRGAVYQWDGASIPVVSTLKACSGAAPLLVGFGQPEDRIHSPNESYGLNQFARAMAWAEKILAALAD